MKIQSEKRKPTESAPDEKKHVRDFLKWLEENQVLPEGVEEMVEALKRN